MDEAQAAFGLLVNLPLPNTGLPDSSSMVKLVAVTLATVQVPLAAVFPLTPLIVICEPSTRVLVLVVVMTIGPLLLTAVIGVLGVRPVDPGLAAIVVLRRPTAGPPPLA